MLGSLAQLFLEKNLYNFLVRFFIFIFLHHLGGENLLNKVLLSVFLVGLKTLDLKSLLLQQMGCKNKSSPSHMCYFNVVFKYLKITKNFNMLRKARQRVTILSGEDLRFSRGGVQIFKKKIRKKTSSH